MRVEQIDFSDRMVTANMVARSLLVEEQKPPVRVSPDMVWFMEAKAASAPPEWRKLIPAMVSSDAYQGDTWYGLGVARVIARVIRDKPNRDEVLGKLEEWSEGNKGMGFLNRVVKQRLSEPDGSSARTGAGKRVSGISASTALTA